MNNKRPDTDIEAAAAAAIRAAQLRPAALVAADPGKLDPVFRQL